MQRCDDKEEKSEVRMLLLELHKEAGIDLATLTYLFTYGNKEGATALRQMNIDTVLKDAETK